MVCLATMVNGRIVGRMVGRSLYFPVRLSDVSRGGSRGGVPLRSEPLLSCQCLRIFPGGFGGEEGGAFIIRPNL